MALTPAQRFSVFEALDITAGPGGGTEEDSAALHNGFALSLTLSEMDQLRDKVDAYLSGLSADAETYVTSLVTQWDAVRLNVGTMDAGAADDLSGLTWSFEEKRALITKYMRVAIPVFKLADAVRRRDQATHGGGYLPFIR